MVTNGDVLDIKVEKTIYVRIRYNFNSVYDGPEDVTKFEQMCKKANLDKKQYVIRHRYFGEDKDFGLTISNRAGMMKNADIAFNL